MFSYNNFRNTFASARTEELRDLLRVIENQPDSLPTQDDMLRALRDEVATRQS